MPIKTVRTENRTKNWRGQEIVTVAEYAEIEGIGTAVNLDGDPMPGLGRIPVYTVDADGTTVTVANVHQVATDMHVVSVGDRVRILAEDRCLIASYNAAQVERL